MVSDIRVVALVTKSLLLDVQSYIHEQNEALLSVPDGFNYFPGEQQRLCLHYILDVIPEHTRRFLTPLMLVLLCRSKSLQSGSKKLEESLLGRVEQLSV